MAKYARIVDGVVAEIIVPVDGVALSDQFQADFVASLVSCADSVSVGYTYSGKTFAAPVAPVPSSAELTAYAALKRFMLETGGYSYEAHAIATDRDSQSKIGNVAIAATIVGTSFSTDWKCSDGTFFTLDHDNAIAMATAVMTFVSACFATEAAVVSAIAGGTITTTEEIDAAAWPSAS